MGGIVPRVSRVVTREDAEKVKRLVEQGYKVDEIVTLLGLSRGLVYRLIFAVGKCPPQRCNPNTLARRIQKAEQAVALIMDNGYNITKAAEIVHIDPVTLSVYIEVNYPDIYQEVRWRRNNHRIKEIEGRILAIVKEKCVATRADVEDDRRIAKNIRRLARSLGRRGIRTLYITRVNLRRTRVVRNSARGFAVFYKDGCQEKVAELILPLIEPNAPRRVVTKYIKALSGDEKLAEIVSRKLKIMRKTNTREASIVP